MKPILNLTFLVLLFCAGHLSASVTLHCPPDQTLPCTAQSVNLVAYGDAYIMKNGKKLPAGLAHVVRSVNSCNVGTITRKWQALGDNQQILECTQTLTFLGGTFNSAHIVWPKTDLQVAGCTAELDPSDLPDGYQEPIVYKQQCSRIGVSYDDEVFNFGSDCKKILRHWKVINWCTFVPGSSQGIWNFTQVIKLSNADEPIISCNKKLVVDATDCDSSYVNVPFVSVEGQSCTSKYAVTNNSMYADTTTHDASGTYPIGTTVFNYNIEYGCGLNKKCQTTVEVTDFVRPVPYCLATLNTVLMPVDSDQDGVVDDGMVAVWAKDVNVGSYHPCHNMPLTFSFAEDSVQMSKVFTCQEVGLNDVRMYVQDHLGRQSYCRVHIVVQNNGANIPNCAPQVGSRPLVSGRILDPSGEGLGGVLVAHKDMAPMSVDQDGKMTELQYLSHQRTDNSGSYSSSDIALRRDYKVYAYKEGDVSLVDSEDVALLESYIKGEKYFANPYTQLAADINEDGTVDVEDFHLIRNLLGAPEESWPNQKQWVFYTKNSVEHLQYNEQNMNLKQDAEIESLYYGYGENIDFIGILKGDLTRYEGF